MRETRSNEMESEDQPHVEWLLGLLGDLSLRRPSPFLRNRLSALASERLKEKARLASRFKSGSVTWLKPAIGACLLIATMGFAAVVLVQLHQRAHSEIDTARRGNHSSIAIGNHPHVTDASGPTLAPRSRFRRAESAVVSRSVGAERVTVGLPYSNSAIATGTGTTIEVAVAQSELLSLGFPINATVQDRCIVAELTLGDDGLPRALSLPLPIETMKEEK